MPDVPFEDLARRLCDAITAGDQRPLQQRVASLVDVLPALLVAGAALPPTPTTPAPPPGPAAERWPGLGRFDDDAPLSAALLTLHAWMWAGLSRFDADDPEGATACWAGGWRAWSTALLECLPGLHAAHLRFTPEPEAPKPRAGGPVVQWLGPGAEPAMVGIAAPPRALKPALGVRFEAIGLGAWVREVHPRGPAAGKLEPGDVVLSVEGVSLEHVDPNVLARLMVGEVGVERAYEVYREGVSREERFAAVDAGSLLRG